MRHTEAPRDALRREGTRGAPGEILGVPSNGHDGHVLGRAGVGPAPRGRVGAGREGIGPAWGILAALIRGYFPDFPRLGFLTVANVRAD